MKCLEKDRERRYESASELAHDIDRYLHNQPVEARPPSTRYRLSKFIRRNKGPVIAAGLLLVVLVGGIIGTTTGFVLADRARESESRRAESERTAKQLAMEKERAAQQSAAQEAKARRAAEAATKVAEDAKDAAEAASDRAHLRLRQIEKSSAILEAIFESLDPRQIALARRPLQSILADTLQKAADELEGDSIGDEVTVAKMQYRMGLSLNALGNPSAAVDLLQRATETLERELGNDDPHTLTVRSEFAEAMLAMGEKDRALALAKETYERACANLGKGSARDIRRHACVCQRTAATATMARGDPIAAGPAGDTTCESRRTAGRRRRQRSCACDQLQTIGTTAQRCKRIRRDH